MFKERVSKFQIQEAEFLAIINSIPDALYIGNPDGITLANQNALDMLGFDSVEELNQHIGILAKRINTRDLKTGKILGVEEQPFYKAFLGETLQQEVVTTHIKSGKEVIVRCSAAPVILDNKVIGAIAINTDITEKIENREKLEDVVQRLKKQNEGLDRFVYNTSHDLKAPLSALVPLLQFIKEENGDVLNEEALKMLDMALEKVDHMDRFIQSLLESATTHMKVKQLIDLNELLKEIIDHLAIPQHIDVLVSHDLPVVKFHKVSLMQVFQNILTNAIKYMDKERGMIKIACEENEKEYILSIYDNGPGIKEDELNRIFMKFHIGHTDPAKNSSGLGLAITRDIIEESEGRIWVESMLGQGATFYFTIPKS